jgi:hypothetical protein
VVWSLYDRNRLDELVLGGVVLRRDDAVVGRLNEFLGVVLLSPVSRSVNWARFCDEDALVGRILDFVFCGTALVGLVVGCLDRVANRLI